MPELPEVQTIVNDLKKKIIGRKIIKVWLDWGRHLKYVTPAKFKRDIKGAKILDVSRRAKNILISLDRKRLLLIHPKMTGLLLVGSNYKPQKHVHLIFYLTGRKFIAFSDVRKFGKVIYGSAEKVLKLPDLKEIGPEPFDVNLSLGGFKKIILSKNKKIKTALMDQKIIAGIGNIYADEILWASKIHPARISSKLSGENIKSIFKNMRLILGRAIQLRGTSISDFRDTTGRIGRYSKKLMAYGKEGKLG